MAQIMGDFETIKHDFGGIGKPKEDYIILPKPLNDYTDIGNGIKLGSVTITEWAT